MTITSEEDCKSLCMSTIGCLLYTYHTREHPSSPNICSLLSSGRLERPVEEDNKCASGPAVCSRGGRCQVAVLVYENATQAILVEQPGTHEVRLVAEEEDCFVDVTLVAIGGGGRYVFYGGGGGSGYVATTKTRLTPGASVKVQVGGEGHDSEVMSALGKGAKLKVERYGLLVFCQPPSRFGLLLDKFLSQFFV